MKRFYVSGFKFHVSGFKFHVSGSKFHVSGSSFKFQILNLKSDSRIIHTAVAYYLHFIASIVPEVSSWQVGERIDVTYTYIGF